MPGIPKKKETSRHTELLIVHVAARRLLVGRRLRRRGRGRPGLATVEHDSPEILQNQADKDLQVVAMDADGLDAKMQRGWVVRGSKEENGTRRARGIKGPRL